MKAYGKITYSEKDNSWIIESLLPHARIKLKSIFPKIKITQQPPYFFKNTLQNANDLHWFSQRFPFDITDSNQRKLSRQKNKCIKLSDELHELMLPSNFPQIDAVLKNNYAFRPHQARNIALHRQVKNLLVGDKVGLGKTLSGIGTAFNSENIPCAIVVEPHLQEQWVSKIKEFTHLDVHAISGTKIYDLPTAHIYVFRYSQLAGWADLFAECFFTSVIYDEIQNLRTGTETAKGAGAKILSDNASSTLGLSATPIYGYGNEIYNIYQFLDADLLGEKSSFIREWCPDGKTVNDPDALGEFLREANAFVRYAKMYKENNVNSYVEEMSHDMEAVKKAEDLAVQLAIRTLNGTFTERGQAARQLDMRLREMTGIAKAKYVAHFVRMIVESGEKVLLAGWHREVYRIWQKELKDLGYVMYTGSESPAQKTKAKEEFINGKTPIMIISLRSGAGLDGIQECCSNVVVGELDWSGEVHKQLIGRVDREGQENQVNAIFTTCNFGSDPVIKDIIGIKSSQSKGIVEPGVEPELVNTDPNRIKKLASQYLKSKGVSI